MPGPKQLIPGFSYTPAQTLPHGRGFVLLDEVVEYGDEHVVCGLTIREDSLFYQPGLGVPAWVAIEYLAQTIAVMGGMARLQTGREVQVALLLGTRGFECDCDYFRAGQRLKSRIELLVQDDSGVGAFDCRLLEGDKVLARAEIKAYQPDDISGYLQSLKENSR